MPREKGRKLVASNRKARHDYEILETHLRWMHQSPPLISRVLNIITTVGFLGFAEIECAGVIDRGDEVWIGGERVGTVLGFDACHFPNHYNILISTPQPRTGPDLGMKPDLGVRFTQSL